MEKGGEEGEIQKRISDKRRVSLYSRDRRSHDLPEKHTRFVLRASTHILTARYRFVIIIGADKRRPFVETYRSFKTRPFSK